MIPFAVVLVRLGALSGDGAGWLQFLCFYICACLEVRECAAAEVPLRTLKQGLAQGIAGLLGYSAVKGAIVILGFFMARLWYPTLWF
jgi:hypothetical protein